MVMATRRPHQVYSKFLSKWTELCKVFALEKKSKHNHKIAETKKNRTEKTMKQSYIVQIQW